MPIGPSPRSMGTLRADRGSRSAMAKLTLAPRPSPAPFLVGVYMAAGRPVVNASAQASGAGLPVVLHGLGALVRPAGPMQPPGGVGKRDPNGVGVEQLLGRCHGPLQGCWQVRFGSRSPSAPMLVASRTGSIGMSLYSSRSPNWRTRSTGQARRWPWGADQAQQPHACRRVASTDPADELQKSAFPT